MTRPWHVWAAFSACLLVVLAAVAWLGRKALELDRAQREAQELALLEGNVRLSLWYLESAAIPILARENARQHFVYASFYPPFQDVGTNLTKASRSDRPSPLLLEEIDDTFLHFQIDPQGRLTSPQVPRDDELARASDLLPRERLELAATRLEELRAVLAGTDAFRRLARGGDAAAAPGAIAQGAGADLQQVRAPVPQPIATPESAAQHGAAAQPPSAAQRDASSQQGPHAQQRLLAQRGPPFEPGLDAQRLELQQERQQAADPVLQQSAVQDVLNRNDFAVRFDNSAALADNIAQAKMPILDEETGEGLMRPFWVGDQLFLARFVSIAGREHVQGCWLNWPELKAHLLDRVAGLLPGADLIPAKGTRGGGEEAARVLAALPVQLLPGEVPAPKDGSALVPWLVLAWVSIALAAGAVAALLRGAVSLSERRAAFVSAVTHELRTPLTTFRMYAEMLSGGMVRDDAKRRGYLETLGREAVRLGHLVENVLAYARLERGRRASRLEPVRLREILDRSLERLEERARQAGMRLEAKAGSPALERFVLADPGVVEQILFNLVDNACKYATVERDGVIELGADELGDEVAIRLRDRGPGIPPSERHRLFRPFSKSAREAANTAPGVGLGLALSRRLAREMGGDLTYDSQAVPGACFVLKLSAPMHKVP